MGVHAKKLVNHMNMDGQNLDAHFLFQYIQSHNDDDNGLTMYALAIYGLVLFPRVRGQIDGQVYYPPMVSYQPVPQRPPFMSPQPVHPWNQNLNTNQRKVSNSLEKKPDQFDPIPMTYSELLPQLIQNSLVVPVSMKSVEPPYQLNHLIQKDLIQIQS
ncbi:hypothetical protein PIB30_074179, partial [Stylosanthes scabra]|nr:hypothetical protein [Stylosanthes scabra]